MQQPLQSRVSLIRGTGNSFLYTFSDFDAANIIQRIINAPSLQFSVPEPFTGVQQKTSITLTFSPISYQDGWRSGVIGKHPGRQRSEPTLAEITMGWDIRGKQARYELYDISTSSTVYQIDGVIADYDIANGSLTIENLDFSALETLIPIVRLSDIFPTLNLESVQFDDPRVCVAFGVMRQVPLTLVYTNGSNIWDFGAIRAPESGATLTVNTVYAGEAVLPVSRYKVLRRVVREYAVFLIRFEFPPTTPNGEIMRVSVDITSNEFATPADAAKFCLSNDLYGLGLSVNSSSFQQASADFTTAGYSVAGGIGPEARIADLVIKDLAMRGSILSTDANGDITWIVDKSSIHSYASYGSLNLVAGYGDGQWNNILSIDSIPTKRLSECVKEYTLQGMYTFGFGKDSYLQLAKAFHEKRRIGKSITEVNPYIGDIQMLRKEAGYRFARLVSEEQKIAFTLSPEMRTLNINDLLKILAPGKGITFSNQQYPWMCSALEIDRKEIRVTCVGYNSSQYTATASYFFSAPAASYLTDYSKTYPEAPIQEPVTGGGGAFITYTAIQGSGSSANGQTMVIATIQVAAPAVNCTHITFRLYRNGDTTYLKQVRKKVNPGDTGIQGKFQVEAGVSWDYTAHAENDKNHPDFVVGVVLTPQNWIGQVAAGDTAAPTQITGLSVVSAPPRGCRLRWSAPAEKDISYIEIQYDTSSSFSAPVSVRTGKNATEHTITGLTVNVTYFFRVRAVDLTGNLGTFSSSVSLLSPKVMETDIGENQVTTTRRQNMSTQSVVLTPPAAPGATHQHTENTASSYTQNALTQTPSPSQVLSSATSAAITHNLGVNPIVILSSPDNAFLCPLWVSARGTNSFKITMSNFTNTAQNITASADYW